MENGSVLIICLLLLIGTVTGQSAPPLSSERLLPQWLTGIIAVSSFLLLTFIGFLVKKMWCEKSSGKKMSNELERPDEHVDGNVYETNMDALHLTKSGESKKENINESCEDEDETSLQVLRNQSRRNVYDNKAMDRTENRSTSM